VVTVQQRILALALELRRAHTAPANVRRIREATALLCLTAGELSAAEVAEIEAAVGTEAKEQANNG
jgi:hypothetical protein